MATKDCSSNRWQYPYSPFAPIPGIPSIERQAFGDAGCWTILGRTCVEQHDLLAALCCFRKAIEIDVDCYDAWMELGSVFMRLADAGRAAACREVARRLRSEADASRTGTN
jgi:uncharacterized protein HemY